MTQAVEVPGVGTLQFPDGMSQPDMAAAIQKNFPQIHKSAAQQAPEPSDPADATPYLAAYSEAGQQLTSGALAAPVAGLVGMFQGLKNTIAPDPTNMTAADRVAQVQNAMTYQPRTPMGQQAAAAINYLPGKIAKYSDAAGDIANKVPVVGPALATGVNVLGNAAPALLMKGAKVLGATRAASAADAGSAASATIDPVAAAKAYVTSHTNLAWDALSDKVKATLVNVASDSRALAHLDPKALETQARLESLPVPVPATAGQLSRDPVQLRNEGNVSATQAGKPIRDIYVAQNKALLDNLDVLKNGTEGTADSPSQVGVSVQDQALRAKLAAKQAQVKGLYTAADNAGETQQQVSIKPIQDLIAQTPDKTHYGYAQSWFNQTVKSSPKLETSINQSAEANDAAIAANNAPKTMSIKDLEDLRKAAVAKQANGGEDAYYAGKLKAAIDQATTGAGGDLYKAARAANVEKEREFNNQSAVARLVEQKAGRPLDRATALENTWNSTVLNGSAEDLSKVRTSLFKDEPTPVPATREAPAQVGKGTQAWRDLQAQTIQHIRDEATKGVAKFEDGTPNVTPAAMERAIRSIGPEKLNILFGPNVVSRLNQIMEATRTVKTEPPTGFKGSPTFANALTFLEKSMISKIPVVGNTAVGIVKAAANLHDLGRTTREINAATTTPLDRAVKQTNALSARKSRNALAGTAITLDQNRLNQ